MADTTKLVFPRIPESNWWTLRDQFAKALPREVSVGYLKTLLQLNQEASARNLQSPLRQLGLIDADEKPTDLANDWRNDAKYASACEIMRQNVYPQELRDLYNDITADKTAVESWFKYTAKLADATAKASAAMYLMLLDPAPKSSADFSKSKTPIKNDNKGNNAAKGTPNSSLPQNTTAKSEKVISPIAPPKEVTDTSNWFSLHIDLQIHISPEASAEQIDQIFASMAKHIDSMKRVKHE